MNEKRVPTLDRALGLFQKIVVEQGLQETPIAVRVKPLTPEEAIGTPERRDFPIIIGKERVVEAGILGTKGQAYTDSPREFDGILNNVLKIELTTNHNRAIFIASLNAVLKYLGMVEATVHCKDEDPEVCAREIADYAYEKYGPKSVGLIGLNPAIAERLADRFGPDNLKITDLNPDNLGQRRFGVEIWDGRERTEDLVRASGLVVLTGTTLVNDTFDGILDSVTKHGKDYLIYGITAAGVCELLGMDRICPQGRSS